MPKRSWVTSANVALLNDLYQLTMAQAYWREEMHGEAVFSLYYRRLPRNRNYLLAAGLGEALEILVDFRFEPDSLTYLAGLDLFREEFLDWLGELRFTGDVVAMPEGTPVFPEEPLLEVIAPLPEAQLVETVLLNQIHAPTVLASKASRIVTAAAGRPVVDFALRRMHGTDAAMKGARAFAIAGVTATSNLLAGQAYGLPVAGTMAHSYVQAHDGELAAFRAFAELYPDTILLVDTYDTLEGIERVVALADELAGSFRVRGVRLDSGDLATLARATRRRLDGAGLDAVKIIASGGLDEAEIGALIAGGAPIDGFGVGTAMGAAADAPAVDMAYKLTSYDGAGRMKVSTEKRVYPGRKQVYRRDDGGVSLGDVVARADDDLPGRPLLRPVMAAGTILEAGRTDLTAARQRAREELDRLPARIRDLETADPPYPVAISPTLEALASSVQEGIGVG